MVGQYVTLHGEVISHVNISRTQVEDGGLYSCSATNRAGTASHSTRLNVYGEAECSERVVRLPPDRLFMNIQIVPMDSE